MRARTPTRRRPELIRVDDSVVCVIDVQERLLPAVQDPGGIVHTIGALLQGARELRIPVMFTEHCAGSIGHTWAELKRLAVDATVIDKTSFCAAAETQYVEAIQATGRRQVILAGTEAHVCVLQTGLGLAAAGVDVFIVADAVASRADRDRDMALQRARDNGVQLVTTEMVLFEWLEVGDCDAFRKLLPVIKQLKSQARTHGDRR